MPKLSIAVIGGSGIYDFAQLIEERSVDTEFGSVPVKVVDVNNTRVAFVCRHGSGHKIPPHLINYRANIRALKSLGVDHIFATNAVGGIGEGCGPGCFIVPDQLIDYSWGREHTFVSSITESLSHVDFTEPFDGALRKIISDVLVRRAESFLEAGVYGCVQGPRLETAAEVQKYKRDGCTVLGMTGMPEAALARELGMAYASICFSVNWAAGLAGPVSIDEVFTQIDQSAQRLKDILAQCITQLASEKAA